MKRLSRNEMKKVMGGNPPNWGTCEVVCGNGAHLQACSCQQAAVFCSFYGDGVQSCSCYGNPICGGE